MAFDCMVRIYERKWLFVSAGVCGAGTRDEPVRTSVWEAIDESATMGLVTPRPDKNVSRVVLIFTLG